MRRSVLAALAALCIGFSVTSAARAADPLVLQLKWFADAQFAGFLVAEAKGFYRKAGLAVTIKPGGPELDPAAALNKGEADVAVNWLASALVARDHGMPLVNIAQIFQHSGMQLTCRRDSGVSRPGDLKGKRLGVWLAGNQYPFLAWMAKLGYRTEGSNPDVVVVPQGGGIELLVQKQAACISTMSYNEYWQVIDARIRPAELTVFRYDDLGVATLEDGLYTTEAKLADPGMRGQLVRFVRASAEGWRYVLAHPDEATRIVLHASHNGATDEAHQRRMLREITRLVAGSPHGIGYLEPAAYERSVGVLLTGSVDPVLQKQPEGAWTHDIWTRALSR